ncbi:MAG TPA: hypothetical protein VGR60_06125 [Gemmatimonadales bacterium]|nr:hypothetical protein [Gemmatimonadales bacterium]
MSTHDTASSATVRALVIGALLSFSTVGALSAQQAALQAPIAAAPAVPAPHASPLFDRGDANAPARASAETASARANGEGRNHTIVVSTLVLVLSVVILVLLIK